MTGNLTVLLTGATGLVGRFLLAEVLRRHVSTIVLVRSQPMRDAVSRIDEALAEFEKQSWLPRPMVVEADLCAPGLGLSPDAWSLLKSQPLRILHSAASIRFEADSAHSEPYRSNVGGTQNLLDVAAQLQVKQFHQVSTAYVQCDRHNDRPRASRTAFEVPVHSEAQAGNDYERSKIRSENLVRSCPHIGPVSIYRPSIVVGDSRTGYTSTYHGFYAPLQIAAGLVRTLGLNRAAADVLRQQLGLQTSDSKNLVPVDWLAAAIVHLMETPAALGGIYHLMHPQPARLHDMQTAILDALDSGLPRRASSNESGALPADYPPEMFGQQMAVYKSYFQDDPPFDRTRAASFLQDLPCPAMDQAALHRLASTAIDNNFGWPRPPAPARLSQRLSINPHKVPSSHSAESLRDIQFELEILGAHQTLDRTQSTLRFCRTAGKWQLNSVLSSNVITSGLRLTVTEESILRALSNSDTLLSLMEQGRFTLRGPWPQDGLDIVRGWLEQIVIVDDQNPS